MTQHHKKSRFNFHRATLRLSQVMVCALVGASLPAHATLGTFPLTGANAHVAATTTLNPKFAVYAQAPGAVTTASGFTVNVVTLDSGTTVKEYVATATNQVFAVVWSGPAMPNLRELLGASFDTFTSAPVGASGLRVGGPSDRSYSANGLVVRSHGVPGHFAGYAYITSAFPPGVTLQTLRSSSAQ